MFKQKFTEIEKTALALIGNYYKEGLKTAGILQFHYEEKTNIFHLQAHYPGLLIGKKGRDCANVIKDINETLIEKGLLKEEAELHFYDSPLNLYLNIAL